jgi:hypothetical protein
MKNSLFPPAVVAGLIGGVIVDAFLALVLRSSPLQIWQYVASAIVGQVAYASLWYAALGFVVHFAVSIFWAVLYVAVVNAVGQTRNWIVGGIVWGVLVDAAMYGILAIKTGISFTQGFEQGLLAHVIFYGLPVAYYVARALHQKKAEHSTT